MSLFQLGNFLLSSGQPSQWKIDCDALDDDDWEALALLAFCQLPNFAAVEGVPRGGLPFAEKLKRYCRPEGGLLLVDDVLTTGGSMERLRAGREAIGCVVFARGKSPDWVMPLFEMRGKV